MVYATENTLKEHGEKVPAEERAKVESAINNLKEVIKGDDLDAIKKAMENMSTASQTLGKIMYEQAAQHQAAAGAGAPAHGEAAPAKEEKKKGDDDVIDAEYEVKE